MAGYQDFLHTKLYEISPLFEGVFWVIGRVDREGRGP
jgi:hypothetical protein